MSDTVFDPADRAILAGHWYAVARSADVVDAPLSARLLDQDLVVYRAGGEVVVADDLCPHRGVPLSMGTGGEALQCAYHGLRFGAGGRCVAVPAHPGARIPERLHLRPYPVRERYGLVWTCVGDPVGELPGFAEFDEPGFQTVVLPPFDVRAFAGRQVEGFLDVGHFAFVHTASFADPENTEVPPYRTEPAPFGFTVDYRSTVANVGAGTVNPFPGARWLRAYAMHLPFTPTLVIHFPDGGRLGILNAATPVGPRETRLFGVVAKDVFTDQTEAEVVEFNLRVFEEDRVIVERQRPENLPTDPRIEVNIPADRSSVAYRRALRDLGLGAFFTV
ncbi:aromatic ring-hydroxylating dioxygenase subunit alpha [Pseudonocardia sp. WMMC193]|uniref:aromatic ring-hydroxylating oxygenase subunit alpha n=1 Tax=Pseudonocardia sp. WMMC193 TaxID=2911965 RepID=UPI001F3612B3|nr:aromatic ring-hydroxylating dioxygenase subunit alpha [Pseudonocardia sp. WMMC193]MCF7549388.1 aromatic ring-hydroxylating dioxygenase subunit alpha [Pseudonocardia sp. WMMC193]